MICCWFTLAQGSRVAGFFTNLVLDWLATDGMARLAWVVWSFSRLPWTYPHNSSWGHGAWVLKHAKPLQAKVCKSHGVNPCPRWGTQSCTTSPEWLYNMQRQIPLPLRRHSRLIPQGLSSVQGGNFLYFGEGNRKQAFDMLSNSYTIELCLQFVWLFLLTLILCFR